MHCRLSQCRHQTERLGGDVTTTLARHCNRVGQREQGGHQHHGVQAVPVYLEPGAVAAEAALRVGSSSVETVTELRRDLTITGSMTSPSKLPLIAACERNGSSTC